MWGGARPGYKLHVALNVFSCCDLTHNNNTNKNNSRQAPGATYLVCAGGRHSTRTGRGSPPASRER